MPDLSGPAAGNAPHASIWPHVEERIVDLVAEHRSTLVFANSRRLAERLTSRLNEIWRSGRMPLSRLPARPTMTVLRRRSWRSRAPAGVRLPSSPAPTTAR